MPTATSFNWEFPWAEFVGVWNTVMAMFDGPVAIAAAIGVALLVATAAISLLNRRRRT